MSRILPLACFLLILASCQSVQREPDSPALAAYKAAMVVRVNAIWLRSAKQHTEELDYGTVKIHFFVRPDGHIDGPKVASNTANKALADVSIQVLHAMRLPPLPKSEPFIECEYAFKVYR